MALPTSLPTSLPATLSGDPQSTDPELTERFRAGDPDAFAELLIRHRDRMANVARRMCRPDDIEDVLQDAFLRAWRAAAAFRGECAITTWLHRIVVTTCLDRLRARSEVLALSESWAMNVPEPRDGHGQAELRVTLGRAMLELPEDQRLAIYLVDVEGVAISDVARQMGCAEGTVKSRCARGRARLAGQLASLRE